MSEQRGKEKLTEYLVEARATELALARTLQAHIAMTPASAYRRGLERHLSETRDHAKRVERRANELGYGRSLPQIGLGLAQTVLGQVLALSKAPLDIARGDTGADKLVRNARDECASEALEIALYDALKGVVASESDLAISTYDKLNAEEIVAKLTELSQMEISKIDAYERRHADRKTVLDRIASLRADEPWPGYDELTVEEIREVISGTDDSTAKRVVDYERRHKGRQGVLGAVERELAHH
jgi:hypothetical protein